MLSAKDLNLILPEVMPLIISERLTTMVEPSEHSK
jgi:hypothetical protein